MSHSQRGALWQVQRVAALTLITLCATAQPGSAQPSTEQMERQEAYERQVAYFARHPGEWNMLMYAGGIILTGLAIAGAVWLVRRKRTTSSGENSKATSGVPDVTRLQRRILRSVFISYRREDSADITGRISDRLVAHFGREAVFKDVDSIPLGQDFRKHLRQAVGGCDALLVIIGRHWCDARSDDGRLRLEDAHDHLRIEVESALEREIPVIPVLVQGATMPDEKTLPESLRSLAFRNAIQVRPDPDFNGDVDRLVRGMNAQFAPAR